MQLPSKEAVGRLVAVLEVMVVQNRFGQKLSHVFHSSQTTGTDEYVTQLQHLSASDYLDSSTNEQIAKAYFKAQREWFAAIAALEELLLPLSNIPSTETPHCQGLLLCRPAPVLSDAALASRFQIGIFPPQAFKNPALMPSQLPTHQEWQPKELTKPVLELALLPDDPIATEQFCVIFTAYFGLVMVLGENTKGIPVFQFSFEPEVVQQAWKILRSRLLLTNHEQLKRLSHLQTQFTPPIPDYRLITEFSRHLLKQSSNLPILETRKTYCTETICEDTTKVVSSNQSVKRQPSASEMLLTDVSKANALDIELLQALTHEIRTPLTTIRTLTRLLLRRTDLTPDIVKRLEVIDLECTEQINRMELIFRAAELETTPLKQKRVQLSPISLEQLLQQSIPRWKKQAQRRNVILDVILPKKLPTVVSDPAMLDQVLTGLMENFTRSLASGGNIQVQVTTAGNQLKLQLLSQRSAGGSSGCCDEQAQCVYSNNPLKALGQLLMFQPETGSLSLNLDVTKNLFQALGGKLIVRQRPQQGEVLTIFLPLGNNQSELETHMGNG